jgi:hypothetical protein
MRKKGRYVLGNELGIDSKATSNNEAISHQEFFSVRDHVAQDCLEKGWKTVYNIKLTKSDSLKRSNI